MKIREVISPLGSIGLNVKQMLQRFVDVEAGDESMSVELCVGEELREALFEPLREDEEEEGEVVLHDADVRLGEFCLAESVITEEDHDATIQIPVGLKRMGMVNGNGEW